MLKVVTQNHVTRHRMPYTLLCIPYTHHSTLMIALLLSIVEMNMCTTQNDCELIISHRGNFNLLLPEKKIELRVNRRQFAVVS